MIAYKFLRSGARALFSHRAWPEPSGAQPGAWVEAAEGPLAACRNGVHACELLDLAWWLSDELWQIELDGERMRGPDAVIARRGRLVRQVSAWNADGKREFARTCAEHADTSLNRAAAEARARAEVYAEPARTFAGMGNATVTSYAAALACSALVLDPNAQLAAFRAARVEQAGFLARVVGIAG